MDWDDRDDAFDSTDLATWPDDSFAGQERDLADLLDDTTLEALGYAYEGHNDLAPISYAVYYLLMMHDEAFLAMTGAAGLGLDNPLAASRMALRNTVRDDANENSGDYFELRLRQRLEEGG